jgi:ATP-dependent helicase Lhr and Lhr-like helicase
LSEIRIDRRVRVTPFEHLHPALQHHIVNSLGWASLRSIQEQAIEPLLAGEHALILGPTAGGKTEAAVLPLLSRMLTERWAGLSLLYVCPIRALLNNLEARLAAYARLVGRRVDLWHGDVGDSARRHIRREPPDILLTTPESIEVMLVSRKSDRRAFFANVKAVVVDELHAFAGDDRGWHLLSVLARVQHIADCELQRVGLSATIGNASDLLDWLAGVGTRPRRIIAPSGGPPTAPDLELDYVGTLGNAAKVIAQLHRGEKRLVFLDSRARVEQLAADLRGQGVVTFVSHSSLSAEERHRAEVAFAEGNDCVIVATSTLELGIDVGDLDRVIQIDSPTTVSAFLQRLGRTGRRPANRRNCLFLASSDETLLRAAGVVQLWSEGYVEPITPPAEPFHILAQQVLALALQEGGVGRSRWQEWVGTVPAFAAMTAEDVQAVLDYMIEHALLFDEAGILSVGPEGERSFGYRNFMELFSVFTSPPLFLVLYGRTEIGHVDEVSFHVRGGATPVLLLGGRSWLVTHLDWSRRLAYVEPTQLEGRSRWGGSSGALHFGLCRAIRRVVINGRCATDLTRRAKEQLATLSEQFAWVDDESTVIVRDGDVRWWTFAGLRANAVLAAALGPLVSPQARPDNLSIPLQRDTSLQTVVAQLESLDSASATIAPVSDDALVGLKFSACVPLGLARRMLQRRLADPAGVAAVLAEPVRAIVLAS